MAIGRIGKYEILERIGEGGMGVVFKAHDSQLLRTVAIKIMPQRELLDREYHQRLLREARALAAVSNPHVALCYACDSGTLEPSSLLAPDVLDPHNGTVDYIVMEYVPGQDLRTYMQERVVPMKESLRLAVQIASGIDAAHEAGVIHRDLTPANIRLTPAGEIKILDFGLARSGGRPESRSTVSASGQTIAGTLGFMAPEQAEGRPIDRRTDLFSFGVILYQLVTGRMPFEGGTTLAVLYAIANTTPPPLTRFAAGVPTELQRIVDKLLEKAPADRYQSAHEVHTDLLRLHETMVHGSARKQPVPMPPAPIKPRVRTPKWAILAGAVVVILLVRVIWPRSAPAVAEAQRVEVMNIGNQTGDPGLDAWCAGLAPDLAGALTQRTELTVSHSAAKNDAGRPIEEPGEAARELGVGHVVVGDVAATESGPQLRLRVINVQNGRQKVQRSFTVALPNSYPSREAIVEELIEALGVRRTRVGGGERRPVVPPSAEAYEAYLHGLGEFEDLDEPLARDRALAAFDRAIAADSGFALAWAERAIALWWLNNRVHDPELLRLASQASAHAVVLGPDLVQTHLAKARTDRASGRMDAAGRELNRALALNPNLDNTYRELGAVMQRTDSKKAEESYLRAVELRPGYWLNWKGLGDCRLMARGDHAGARAAYLKVIELQPKSNRGYEGLGNSYMIEGRYADAMAAYRRMPRPVTSSTLASNIANAYFFSHQLDGALQYYLMATSLEPNDPALRQNLGDCYRRMQREPEARQQYLEAVKLHRSVLGSDRESPKLRVQMAVYFAKAAECDSAATWLDSAELVLPTNDAELFHELAKAHALCGHHSEAIVLLRKMRRAGGALGMLRDEDEFRGLRQEPEFQRLFKDT